MKKTFKKIMAALLAVALLCAMAVPAFAAEGASGTITIDNALNGESYTAYKIFDVVSSKKETDGSTTGNTNTAQLKYGNNSTVESTTTTYSYKFDLV